MSDSTRRAIRTFFDLAPGFLVTLGIVVGLLDLSVETTAKVSGVLAGATLILAKLRNAAEDAGLVPAVLKAPPSPGENPVPGPPRKRTQAGKKTASAKRRR